MAWIVEYGEGFASLFNNLPIGLDLRMRISVELTSSIANFDTRAVKLTRELGSKSTTSNANKNCCLTAAISLGTSFESTCREVFINRPLVNMSHVAALAG